MNIFKKVYCRVFQFGFKIAIPILPYYNPNILDKVEEIPSILQLKKIKKILLVTDKSIKSLGITAPLEKKLKESDISVIVFDNVVSNPTIENVEQARQIYLENNCECLIGFGGGSALLPYPSGHNRGPVDARYGHCGRAFRTG